MAIFLEILKITGLIILCIIAIATLLLLFVLHVPVRYKANIKINKRDVLINYSFSWFFHFFYLGGSHGDKGHRARLRIFGIPIKTYFSKKAAEIAEKEETDEEKADIGIKDKLLNIITKFLNFKERYSNDSAAYEHLLNELIRLLKRYKPSKVHGYLDFGFDDPSITGMLLGIYYAIYPVSPEDFRVTGNFEEASLDCDFNIKGNMHFRALAAALIRLYKDKAVLKLFRDREKKHGRK